MSMIDLENLKKQFGPVKRGEPDYAFQFVDVNILELVTALEEARDIIEDYNNHSADYSGSCLQWLSKYFPAKDNK